MSKKRIKVGKTFIEVDEKDIEDVDAPTGDELDEEEEEEEEPDDDGGGSGDGDDEGEKSLKKSAEAMGKKIAKEIMGNVDNSGVKALEKKLNNFMELQFGSDTKLKDILGGKDLYAKDQLTKEEKIVGFFHALVTDNSIALKALSEGTDADGGYLFPNEFLEELIRDLPEINVMRNEVRIITMRRNKMDITSLVSGPKVTWTLENAAKSTTTAHFGTQTLTAYKLAAILYSSDELIEDSDIFDVVAMIIRLFSEAIANEEERVIWVGDGTTQPEGLDTATIASVAAVGQDFDDVISLYYALPSKYRTGAKWYMNDNTAKEASKIKDSNGQYIWQPSVSEAGTDRMRGKPVVYSDWVPDNQIYFGDLKKGYFLGDRKRITVKVSNDTETAFTKDQTAIRVVERIGGKVVLPAAIRKLTGF